MKRNARFLYRSLSGAIVLAAVLVAGCSSQNARMVQSGNRAIEAGNFEQATQSFQRIPLDERDEDVALKLAWLYWRQGQDQACLDELATITKNRPAQADYLASLCYIKQNDLSRARQHTEMSLQKDPRNSLAIAQLGKILFLEKQYPQSIAAYKEAIEMSADPAVRLKLYYNLAMAQLLAGDFRGADQSFSQYLVHQQYISSEDNRMAGSIAYANGDHQRAYRHWSQLDPVSKKQILESIDHDSELYSQLARRP